MDDALVLVSKRDASFHSRGVLILVVMDDALVQF